MKSEFWRKLQDDLVFDYLKKKLCPVTTMVSMTKVVKDKFLSGVLFYFGHWSLQQGIAM